MKRSHFILLSAAGITALGGTYWYLNFYDPENPKTLDTPQELSHIWDATMIKAMGQAYRMQVPMEDNKHLLEELLLSNESDQLLAIDALKKSVTIDFKTGNTIILDGWILAQTEARQCALFSITSQ